MLHRRLTHLGLTLAVPALALSLIGCSGTDGNNQESCAEPNLQHSPIPFRLQEAFPPPQDGQENRGDKSRTPYETTFHLYSSCRSKEVEVETSCLIGEGQQTGSGKQTQHFTMEGPKPRNVDEDRGSVIRLTYNRESPNKGDDVDNVAMVVQSNAGNLPTLVVPVCARVIEKTDDAKPKLVECDSPVEPPAPGTTEDGLCGG